MKLQNAAYHYGQMLKELGVDLDKIPETPERHVKFLAEALTQETVDFTVFDTPVKASGMLIQGPIPFSSLCAHHVLPFFGVAVVAYIPYDRLAGLSKLARVVKACSKGLQLQEHITDAIADTLCAKLNTNSVAVTIRAVHLCMAIRGVRVHDTNTTTTCLRGAFELPQTRAEFLATARAEMV